MRKYIGAICSGLLSALTFVLMSINFVITEVTTFDSGVYIEKTKVGINGWNLIGDSDCVKGHTLYSLAAILLIIISILLLVNIVFISLQKTKVIKVNFSFSKLNILLLTIFEILSTIMIIAMSLMCKDLSYIEFVSETTKIEVVAKIVFAGWSLMVIGLIAWLIAWFSEESKSKD